MGTVSPPFIHLYHRFTSTLKVHFALAAVFLVFLPCPALLHRIRSSLWAPKRTRTPPKSQPWKAHWPPKSPVTAGEKHGFKQGQKIELEGTASGVHVMKVDKDAQK